MSTLPYVIPCTSTDTGQTSDSSDGNSDDKRAGDTGKVILIYNNTNLTKQLCACLFIVESLSCEFPIPPLTYSKTFHPKTGQRVLRSHRTNDGEKDKERTSPQTGNDSRSGSSQAQAHLNSNKSPTPSGSVSI